MVIHELHPNAKARDEAAFIADLLVILMGMAVELLRLLHQRRLLGRPTELERLMAPSGRAGVGSAGHFEDIAAIAWSLDHFRQASATDPSDPMPWCSSV